MNRANHLFIVPPFNNVTYRVDPINRNDEYFEKVVEFKTGVRQTIMDIILMIDIQRHKINYIVCNRERTYVAFREGTDAIEVMNKLRQNGIASSYATCYAYIAYLEDNAEDVDMAIIPQPQARIVPPRVNLPRINRPPDNIPRALPARNMYANQHQGRINPMRSNQYRRRLGMNNRYFNNRQDQQHVQGNNYRVNNFDNFNNNVNNRSRVIRVEVPANVNQNQFEIMLVRK